MNTGYRSVFCYLLWLFVVVVVVDVVVCWALPPPLTVNTEYRSDFCYSLWLLWFLLLFLIFVVCCYILRTACMTVSLNTTVFVTRCQNIVLPVHFTTHGYYIPRLFRYYKKYQGWWYSCWCSGGGAGACHRAWGLWSDQTKARERQLWRTTSHGDCLHMVGVVVIMILMVVVIHCGS